MISRKDAELFLHYLRPYKLHIGKISLLVIIGAFFEAVNIGALVPLLQLLSSPTDPGGMFWDSLKKVFGFFFIELNFVNLLIVIGIVFLTGQAILYRKKRLQANLWFTFSADLKNALFGQLLTTDISYHYSQKSGKFIDILNRQAEYSTTSVFSITEILSNIFFILVYAVILLYISVELTIICLIIALSTLYFLNFLIKRSKQIGLLCNNTNIRMNEFVTERLGLLKLIKIFSTEREEADKLKKITDQYTTNNTNFWMNGVKIETAFQIIIFTLALSILYISTVMLNLPLAMLLVFIFILVRLTDPLRQINTKRHDLGGQVASLEMIDRTLRETAEHKKIINGIRKFDTVNDRIEISHVNFSYSESIPVLKEISFSIRKNEMVALVGASGGGKSTIVDLIIRLIEPGSGSISIDGTDIRDFDIREYHSKIGFVSQDSYIFNASILENVCYGSDEKSLERAMEAARIANAHEFICSLPKGYDTELGERGVKISGGQKQRIALARAIYRNPEILILDEATSSLDSESEKIIQDSIDKIKQKFTILAIAHRLSTIENADLVIVIENGAIAESGNHEDLIRRGGVYARYQNIQRGKPNSPEQDSLDLDT
ncbi:MAG: ABC transporter ATP-binding protein [Methanoregula sp.]|nr:ABC transporter ATP-binding protein [Methanoregula sp.]